jgi:hypothetical protein
MQTSARSSFNPQLSCLQIIIPASVQIIMASVQIDIIPVINNSSIKFLSQSSPLSQLCQYFL